MSKYTTGEIAKLCGVTVRTVQYYDSRNILVPTELSDGGRRLYSEEDLQKLKIICFLRNIDLPINSIAKLFEEDNPENVIKILLEQQEMTLREEVRERQLKLQTLNELEKELKSIKNFSVESVGDIAYKMENKIKLKKTRTAMFAVGLCMDAIEAATLVLWITKGIWWPFVAGMLIVIIMGAIISLYYFKHTAYICPQCHKVFKPAFRDVFLAAHTPNLRKLTCTECGHHGFCIEAYDTSETYTEEK